MLFQIREWGRRGNAGHRDATTVKLNDQRPDEPGYTDYRNPGLAEAMKVLGFVQRFGIGIQTAQRALASNGNPPVEFDPQDTLVLATIRRGR